MSDAAAGRRRSRPQAALCALPWRSALARRIVAAHLLTAGAALAAAFAVGGVAPAPLHLATAVAIAAAAALWIGTRLARRIANPVGAMLRAVDAGFVPVAAAPEDELVRLDGGVRRLLGTLADRVAANETFAADVAHEIRNPLASLRAAAEALTCAQPEQRAHLAVVIARDVARLDRLVGEIAGASRLDIELVHEQAEEFDLLATIRSLAAHFAPLAAGRGVELAADLPTANSLPILGLEARLAQVLVNLLENAISLCETGDAIHLRVRRQERRVLLVVEDTGPGIPDGEADRIFRRFYSYRPGASGEHSGLGLAISRQIVEAHGGLIWAENIRPTASDLLSQPLGARFVVVLPQ